MATLTLRRSLAVQKRFLQQSERAAYEQSHREPRPSDNPKAYAVTLYCSSLSARNVSAPTNVFFVECYKPGYHNEYWHPGGWITLQVRAETAELAIKVVSYHYGYSTEHLVITREASLERGTMGFVVSFKAIAE